MNRWRAHFQCALVGGSVSSGCKSNVGNTHFKGVIHGSSSQGDLSSWVVIDTDGGNRTVGSLARGTVFVVGYSRCKKIADFWNLRMVRHGRHDLKLANRKRSNAYLLAKIEYFVQYYKLLTIQFVVIKIAFQQGREVAHDIVGIVYRSRGRKIRGGFGSLGSGTCKRHDLDIPYLLEAR